MKTDYALLLSQLEGLFQAETDPMANMANTAAVLFNGMEQLNWAGFYRLCGRELVLGPFQGKPACVRIALGKGVCGTAAQTAQTQRIADVHQFAGHIACDPASRSEIVVPIFKAGSVWGVLDMDAPVADRFSPEDQHFLERVVALFAEKTAL
ncbi:MAG: GAF domain-containing protein [Elusimicrobiaceae bacterium]|nr:GAF domain-containing protein [Elusimicrobiaceae bacterium]